MVDAASVVDGTWLLADRWDECAPVSLDEACQQSQEKSHVMLERLCENDRHRENIHASQALREKYVEVRVLPGVLL